MKIFILLVMVLVYPYPSFSAGGQSPIGAYEYFKTVHIKYPLFKKKDVLEKTKNNSSQKTPPEDIEPRAGEQYLPNRIFPSKKTPFHFFYE